MRLQLLQERVESIVLNSRMSSAHAPFNPVPRHPGKVLETEYLVPQNISHYDLAKQLHITETSLDHFIAGETDVDYVLAFGLAHVFRESPELWIRRQQDWDTFLEQEH